MRTAMQLCLAVSLLAASPAFAGSRAQEGAAHFSPDALVGFAKHVEHVLANRGARVAIVARIGRPPKELPAGIRYTHTAFVVYSLIQTADGRTVPGYAFYNLYQKPDRLNESVLATDYPIDFFAGVYALEAGLIVPSPKLQARLLGLIGSDTYRRLHNPRYSVLANPFNAEFQNCTEFVLDVVNAAVYQTADNRQLKANAQAYFRPQLVQLPTLKLWLGDFLSEELTLADHDGVPQVATFTTLAAYLLKYGMALEALAVTPEGVASLPQLEPPPVVSAGDSASAD